MLLIKAKPLIIQQSPASLYADSHARIVAGVTAFLDAQAKIIIPQILGSFNHARKHLISRLVKERQNLSPEQMAQNVALSGWGDMVGVYITAEIKAAFDSAGLYAIDSLAAAQEGGQVENVTSSIDVMTNLINDRAVEYAKTESATLVTQITESTRNMIQQIVANAIESGQGSFGLADVLSARAFSPQRADLIASYELGTAACAGNMEAWKASGVVTDKAWITADDEIVSVTCTLNAEQGYIPLDDAFQSGHKHPLAHPHCRCGIVAKVVIKNNT